MESREKTPPPLIAASPPPSDASHISSKRHNTTRSRAWHNRGTATSSDHARDRPTPAEETHWSTAKPSQDSLTNPSEPPHKAPAGERIIPPGRPPPNPDSPPPPPDGESNDTSLIREPETRPISQEQLVAEVKGIYAGLVMVESKCIEVDNAQNAQKDQPQKLNNEQWQALIALHRTLLHEHHDFFLASQHPSASVALQRLASKYSMPARMWRHGIHSFLELLRHRLPASLEHMLTFIYLAYSMMALLYETVPAFEDTWIECLGDLGRYRMAIEEDNIHDREIWTGVSRHWYGKASDKAPTTGRLYHHLAILARPNALQQLFYYIKSLCVSIPFLSARDSVMTLFEPLLGDGAHRLQPIDADFVRAHGILFSRRSPDKLAPSINSFLSQLDNHIARTTKRWMETGYYIAITNICGLMQYSSDVSFLSKSSKPRRQDETDTAMADADVSIRLDDTFHSVLDLFSRTSGVVLRRYGDPNTYPYLHVTLTFLLHLSTQTPEMMEHVEHHFTWALLAEMLNALLSSTENIRFESSEFPSSAGTREDSRPLPEDYAMRGLVWTEGYFPDSWFTSKRVDDEERYLEIASMTEERKTRCLWIGVRLAEHRKWLLYNQSSKQFETTPRFDRQSDLGQPEGDEAMPDADAKRTDIVEAADSKVPALIM